LSDKLATIEKQLQDDNEKLDMIQRDLRGHQAAVTRQINVMAEDTTNALKYARKSLHKVRELVYAVRENRKELAIERHRVDNLERAVKRIPEECHRGRALAEHLQAHATNLDNRKFRLSWASIIPAYVTAGLALAGYILTVAGVIK